MTTDSPASFPKLMVIVGWLLAATMLLYPIEAVPAWLNAREAIESSQALVGEQGGGHHIDLRMAIIHCGPMGWAGGIAAFLGIMWVGVGSGLWLYYRRRGHTLMGSSRLAFVAVLGGMALVFGTQEAIWRVSGIMVTDLGRSQVHESARCITTRCS